MDSGKEQYFDFLCLTCMIEFAEVTSNKEIQHQWQSIYDTIDECGALRIADLISNTIPQINMQLSDELPNKICRECLQNLLSASRFQQMCLQSQHQIRALIAKRNSESKITLEGPQFLKHEPILEATYEGSEILSGNNSLEFLQQRAEYSMTTEAPLEEDLRTEFLKQEPQSEFDLPESQYSGSLLNIGKTIEHDINLHGDVSEFLKNEPYEDNQPSVAHSNAEIVANEPCDDDEFTLENSDCGTMYSIDTVDNKEILVGTEEKQVRMGISKHKCQLCDKSFTQARYLARHLQRHERWEKYGKPLNKMTREEKQVSVGSSTPNCHLCNRSFTQQRYLARHLKRHKKWDGKNEMNAKSNNNGKPYVENEVLIAETEEKQVSLGPSTHKCHLCNKSFTQARYLARHLKLHIKRGEKIEMDAPENACELCEERFSTPSLLEKHKISMHDTNRPEETIQNMNHLPCDLCNVKCTSLSTLKRHKTIHHSTEKQEETVYSCDFCDKTFKWPFMLRSHVENAHIKGRSYTCTICSKSFNTSSRLNVHRYRHRDDNPFDCAYCPLRFRCRRDVIKHRKDMHKGVKPHLCDICGASFTTIDLLKKHRVLHSGMKPYKCDYCDKCFARTENRSNHMRIHTGEKPYKCKFCERPYAQLSELTYHLRAHLGENVYRCELCPLAFPLASEKRLHLVTHENEAPEIRERNLKALKEEDAKLKSKVAANEK